MLINISKTQIDICTNNIIDAIKFYGFFVKKLQRNVSNDTLGSNIPVNLIALNCSADTNGPEQFYDRNCLKLEEKRGWRHARGPPFEVL